MKRIARHLLAVVAVAASSATARCDEPYPFVFHPPLLVAHQDAFVLQASCWTLNENLYGVQISAVLGMSVSCCGVQAGLANIAKNLRGVQAGLFLNEVQTSAYGLQIGLLNVIHTDTEGVFAQVGLLNITESAGRKIKSVYPLVAIHW